MRKLADDLRFAQELFLFGGRAERMHERLERNSASEHRGTRFIDAARRPAAQGYVDPVAGFPHHRGPTRSLSRYLRREDLGWTVANRDCPWAQCCSLAWLIFARKTVGTNGPVVQACLNRCTTAFPVDCSILNNDINAL